MSVLDEWRKQMVADAPPLTAKARDLIAACFAGVELGAEAPAEAVAA